MSSIHTVNVQDERTNQDMKHNLWRNISEHQKDWDVHSWEASYLLQGIFTLCSSCQNPSFLNFH